LWKLGGAGIGSSFTRGSAGTGKVCIVQDFGMMNRTVHEAFQTQVVVFYDPVSAAHRSALRRAQDEAAFAPQFRACGPQP